MALTELTVKDVKKKLVLIIQDIDDGNIVTASYAIKVLAVRLDRQGYATPLKDVVGQIAQLGIKGELRCQKQDLK